MHFPSVRSVLVLFLPVVIAVKQLRGLFVSHISSCVVFAARKRDAVSDPQGFIAILTSGDTSCR